MKRYSFYPRYYLPAVSGPSANLVFKKRQSDIRVQKSRVPHVSAQPRTKIREIGEIRVPNKNIRFIRVVRVQKTVSATPRTNIRESAIRVQKNIRDIRFIRVQNIS